MIIFVGRIVVTVICLGLVVMIHELGHFLAARRLGVRVERFTIGFGREILGWTRGDTRYAVCVLPLGGMVKLAGEYPEEGAQRPDEFFSQAWYRRVGIVLAGPAMNYVLAYALFAAVAGFWGTLQPSSDPVIGDMVAGLPAAQAHLLIGDRILSINQVPITSWEQMARLIHEKPEQKLVMSVERLAESPKAKPQMVSATLTPQWDAAHAMGLIGIMPQVEKVRVGLRGSLAVGWKDTATFTLQPMRYIKQKIIRRESPRDLSGPLGIVQMVTKATQEGAASVMYLIAIISTGLGLFNLFPIPFLDGGHAFLYAIEGLIRRPLSRRVMQVVNAIGLSLILTIFLYASYQDLLRLGLWK